MKRTMYTSFTNTRLTSNSHSNQQPPILGTKKSVNLLLAFANQKHANMMCLVNITTTTFTFTYLMNVNCVIGQATPILTHSSTNVMCFGVKKLRPPKREQNARPHLLFTSKLLLYSIRRMMQGAPFLSLVIEIFVQNLKVYLF